MSHMTVGLWPEIKSAVPRVSADTEAKPTPPVHVAAATRPLQLPPLGVGTAV